MAINEQIPEGTPPIRVTKAELGTRLANLSFGARAPSISPAQWAVRERVAVRVEYDLDDLQAGDGGPDPEEQEAMRKVLAESTVAYPAPDRPAWRLRHDVRRETLRRLADQGRLQTMLEANPSSYPSTLQTIFAGYIRGQAPPLEAQRLDELEATVQAVDWLDGCVADLPAPEAINRRLARERLLKPFRFLVGDHFRGREEELKVLREYVGVLGEGNGEVKRSFNLWDDPPLAIFGPGGVGKSTLVAKFILEHAELDDERRFPYIYIDFNRRDLDIEEPVSILLEAARQIAVQYALDEERWKRLQEEWHVRSGEFTVGSGPVTKMAAQYSQEAVGSFRQREWDRYVSEFTSEISQILRPDRPFLLVMDTLEELLYHRIEYFDNLWLFLNSLLEQIPVLRVVFSGRSPLPGNYPTQQLELKGLDPEAAVALLLARGLPDEAFARQVVEIVGRSPLNLCLAADLYGRMGGDRGAFLELEERQEYFFQVKEYLIQGVLYRRILGHIHDPRVRALAHPGMVLRRITPELILNVLAEAIKIDVTDLDDAQRLFDQLRLEVSVVEIDQVSPNELRQRPELRLAMLELLHQDEREKVRKIHRRAAEYFHARVAAQADPSIPDQADEIYHRLALEDAPGFLDERPLAELEQIARELGGAIYDLPVEAQTYLASRVDVEVQLGPEVWEAADLKSWEFRTASRVQNLVNLTRYKEALQRLEERQERSIGSPLYPLEVLTWKGLKDRGQARAALEEGLRRTPPNSPEQQELLLLAAELDEEEVQFDEARQNYRRALAIAERLHNAVDELRIRLNLQRLATSLFSAEAPELAEEIEGLLQAWRAVSDEELLANPLLIRSTASQLGVQSEEVVKRTVRLVGLGGEKPANVEALASTVASWDDLLSAQHNEPPGVLARAARLDAQADLFATWRIFLEEMPWDKAAHSLVRLVADFPLNPSISISLIELTKTHLLLNPQQAELLRVVLLEAFTPDQLDTLVRAEFNRSLVEISHAETFEHQVDDLMSWAESTGKLAHLVQTLRVERPAHPGIAGLLRALGLETGPPPDLTDPQKAAEFYTLAVEKTLKDGDQVAAAGAQAGLARAYLDLGELEAAETALHKAVELDEAAFGPDHPNTARDLAELGRLLLGKGQAEAALEALQRALAIDRAALGPDHLLTAQDLEGVGLVYWNLGQAEQARQALQAAVEIAAGALGQDDPVTGLYTHQLAIFLHYSGAPDEAIPLYRQALEAAQRNGRSDDESVLLNALGNVYFETGAIPTAVDFYTRALDVARTLDDAPQLGAALIAMAAACRMTGELEQAQILAEEALEVARQSQDQSLEGHAHNTLGLVTADRGDFKAAADQYDQALALFREAENRQGEINTLSNLGLVQINLGRKEQAVDTLEQALALAEILGDQRGRMKILNNLGLTYTGLNRLSEAVQVFETSLLEARALGDRLSEANTVGNLGLLYEQLGDLIKAVEFHTTQLTITREIGERRGEASALNNLANVRLQLGEYSQALEGYLQALELAGREQDRALAANAQFGAGLAYLELGEPARAVDQFQASLGFYRQVGHPNTQQVEIYLAQAQEAAGSARTINTGGGIYVSGSMNVSAGDFVGRDKVNVSEIRPSSERGAPLGPASTRQAEFERMARAVCRGELVSKDRQLFYLTAFLVGPDLVMTAYHAVKDILDGGAPPENLTFRFDLLITQASNIISQGQAYALAAGSEARERFRGESPWVAAANPELEYALFRLARPAGLETPGGVRSARPRGWLKLAAGAQLAPGDGLGLFQFQQGTALVSDFQEKAFEGFAAGGQRLVHTLNSSPGASGGPLIDRDLEVVGIQQGRGRGDPDRPPETQEMERFRFGAFIQPVIEDLERQGVWPLPEYEPQW